MVNIDTGEKNYGVFSSIADAKSVNLYIHDDQMFFGKHNYHSKTYKEASSSECPICNSTIVANLGDGRMKDMLDNHVDIHWSVTQPAQFILGLGTFIGSAITVIRSPSAGPFAIPVADIAIMSAYAGINTMTNSLTSTIYIK